MEIRRFQFVTEKRRLDRKFVGDRFEYFYHYWSLTSIKYIELIIEKYKFESHITLLAKVIGFIEQSYKDGKKPFISFFVEHPFFANNNIIIKDSKIIDLVYSTQVLSYENDKKLIVENLEKIYVYFTKKINYSKRLTHYLQLILSKNRPIDENFEADVRMLVNAIIVELYKEGYSEEYIVKIPNIITLSDPLNDYPFLELGTIKTRQDYKDLVNSKKITLAFYIQGISNLFTKNKFKGYVFFNIPGVDFMLDKPMEIGECTFYNPSRIKLVTDHKAVGPDSSAERFVSREGTDKRIKPSTCNVYLPISLRYPVNNVHVHEEVIKKRVIANKSLTLLLVLKSVKSDFEVRVSSHKVFVTNENFKVASFSYGIFNDDKKVLVRHDEDFDKWQNEAVSSFNRLREDIEFHQKIRDIIFQEAFLRNNINEFRFSKLWIVWESLINKEQFIQLSQACFRLHLKKNFIIKMMLLLESYLKQYNFYKERSDRVKLSDYKLNKYGLKIPVGRPISPRKFLDNYETLFAEVDHPVTRLIKKEIDAFVNNESTYWSGADDWVRQVINEVHLERHVEIHRNAFHDFSTIKLKRAFLFISRLNTSYILHFMNKRNEKDLNKIRRKIKNA